MTQRTCRVPVGFKRVVQVSNRDSASVESAGRAAKHFRVAGDIGKDAVGGGSTSSSDDSSGDESSNEKIEEGMERTHEEWMATHEDEEAGLATSFSAEDDAGKTRKSAGNRRKRQKRLRGSWSRSRRMRLMRLQLLRWRGRMGVKEEEEEEEEEEEIFCYCKMTYDPEDGRRWWRAVAARAGTISISLRTRRER